jgi:hypothetical protein
LSITIRCVSENFETVLGIKIKINLASSDFGGGSSSVETLFTATAAKGVL